jgi:hypothetical protein
MKSDKGLMVEEHRNNIGAAVHAAANRRKLIEVERDQLRDLVEQLQRENWELKEQLKSYTKQEG